MSEELEQKISTFIDDWYDTTIYQNEQFENISSELKKNNSSKDLNTLIEKQDILIKNQSKIIDELSKTKNNIDYEKLNEILANNVKDLKINSKELIQVNNKLYDKSDSGFHSFYYLGSVIIGFFIGYVVINTFLQLAFDN